MTIDTNPDAGTEQAPAAPAHVASPEAMEAARGWASDCDWRESLEYGIDPDELVADMSDAEVKASVDKHYDGGWPALLRDAGLPEQAAADPEVEA